MEQAKARLGCAIPGAMFVAMFVAAAALAAALLAHGGRDRTKAHARLGAPHAVVAAVVAAPAVVERR